MLRLIFALQGWESSSDGMRCGDWCVDSGVIVDGLPEVASIVLELGALGSM